MTHNPPRLLQLENPWVVRPDPMPAAAEEQVFWPDGPLSLQDVVDSPARSLFVEYKSWRNLRNPEDQAEIARDIAALANAGGGAIAFGFDEDTLAPADIDPFRTPCDEAALEVILHTFLDPVPDCEMLSLGATTVAACAVIRVGPHGGTPVFVRGYGLPPASLRLIQPGAIYIRRHAPPRRGEIAPRVESAPVSAPAEWLPLVRRCVRLERETLLGAIEAVVEGRREAPAETERLRRFHDAARAGFLALAAPTPMSGRLLARHHVLSYALDLGRPELLEPVQMPELLSRVVHAVQQHIRIGTRLFDPPYLRAARPRFVTDPAIGDDEVDMLETAWLRDTSQTERTELWRVSARGLASVVRPYAEDEPAPAAPIGTAPIGTAPTGPGPVGPWLSPSLLARDLAELVLHARALARVFGSARAVSFRCEWLGLEGCQLHDPSIRWARVNLSLVDRRVTALRVPLGSLAQDWPETVARLMAPVLRMIEPDLALGAEWVRAQMVAWK